MADQNIVNNAINYLQEQQNDIIKSEVRPTDVRAPETVTEVKIYQDNVTNKWIKDEKEVEGPKDDNQLAIIEQKLIDTPIALQESCAIVDNKIIAINAQINGLKSQIASLSAEATAGNCWPGIACSSTIFSPTICYPGDINADFSTKTTIKEDQEIIKVYPKLAGPQVDYTAINPFVPDTTYVLSSQYSGYGYENVKQDDQGATVTTGARLDLASNVSDHQAKTFNNGFYQFYYKGAGVSPATDTSVTPSRCVEIKNQIDSLTAQIATLRVERDSQNRTSLNVLKDKKTGDEVRSWGLISNRNAIEQLKTDNNAAIAALSDLL